MLPFETLSRRGQIQRLRKLAQQALSSYAVDVRRLTPLAHGDNTTFRVDTADGGRYVLRIHRSALKTVEVVRSELLWLTELRKEPDLLVPEPVPTVTGGLLTVTGVAGVPEPRICVLLRWLPGRFLDEGLTPSHLYRVGGFMARLQISAASYTPPEGFVRGRLDHLYGKPRGISEAYARQHVDNPEDEAKTLQLVADSCSYDDAARVERFIQKVRMAQLQLGQGTDTFGLIHGDLHQENYLFHNGRVGAIDFDDCGYGFYTYDLAVTLVNLTPREGMSQLREGLLAGYRSVRSLAIEHEQAIDIFMDFRDLQIMIWNLEMRNHPAFRDSWAAHVRSMLEYLKELVG
jgi:Ser/Thr protein kinase RdoA (MazF antagonist)